MVLGLIVVGSVIAGAYGIVHDQVTYSLAPEYFTKFKFLQFQLTEVAAPERLRAAVVGCLATWWVGLIASWFLCRSVLAKNPDAPLWRPVLKGYGIIIVTGVLAGIIGWFYGVLSARHPEGWQSFANTFQVDDLPAFIRVGCIHNASYLGGLIGLIVAIWRLRRK